MDEELIVTSKACGFCKETKAISEYHKDKWAKDGTRPYCKSCIKIKNSEYQKKRKKGLEDPAPVIA